MFKRIAFSGKARSGKNTAADYFINNHGYKEVRFSDPLYKIHDEVFNMMGIPPYKCAPLLQLIGTDIGRAHDPDIWIKAMVKQVAELGDTFMVCTDARFVNEVELLRGLGFLVIRIERSNRPPTGRDDNHPSETALDNYHNFDAVIHNDGSIEDLHKAVVSTIRKHLYG